MRGEPWRNQRPNPIWQSRTPLSTELPSTSSGLLKLRWAALIGQMMTIVLVALITKADLPLLPLFAILAIEAGSNLAYTRWFRRRATVGLLAERGDWLVASIMVLDMGFLTALLHLTGGPANPFAVFFLVNIALATVVLSLSWSVIVSLLALCAYAGLFLSSQPLDPPLGLLELGSIEIAGMLTAFVTAGGVLTYFVHHVNEQLERRESQLALIRQRKINSDRLAALATLAGGAAHELSSPLSTIAVVARELELELEGSGSPDESIDDARLIRTEVARCRGILDQMAANAGESAGEEMVSLDLPRLIEDACETLAPSGMGGREDFTGGGGLRALRAAAGLGSDSARLDQEWTRRERARRSRSRSRRDRKATVSRSSSPTEAAGCRRRCSSTASTHSSPPKKPGAEWGWASSSAER